MEASKFMNECTTGNGVASSSKNSSEDHESRSSECSKTSLAKGSTEIPLAKSENQSSDSSSVETPSQLMENSKDAGYIYEKIDGVYHYTNPTTNEQYRYDDNEQNWTLVANGESSKSKSDVNSDATVENHVHVDEEGRTFYHADGHYLCRYPTGHVYYMNESQEWVLWSDDNLVSLNNNPVSEDNDANKWYYYKGEDAFYRDNSTSSVFKLNKETNEWCLMKPGKKRKKRISSKSTAGGDEEFDTDSSDDDGECGYESEETEDAVSGDVPPGYNKDPSISFEDGSFIKRDKDGMMYDWDKHRRAWFPKLDETFMAKYQMSYGFNPDGSKNLNPVKYDDDEEEDDIEEQTREMENKKKEEEKKKKEKKPAGWFEADDAYNTKVYVSQLPEDTTEQQFVDLMQKCGLVLKDPETGQYKVKLYKDKQGNFKGDALCTYIKAAADVCWVASSAGHMLATLAWSRVTAVAASPCSVTLTPSLQMLAFNFVLCSQSSSLLSEAGCQTVLFECLYSEYLLVKYSVIMIFLMLKLRLELYNITSLVDYHQLGRPSPAGSTGERICLRAERPGFESRCRHG
ncbi:RNA recognition motif domain [Trinorchestia longiramus]|nr:RNA recognition motif domain [Trinorchestia longiramus]